MNSQGRFRSFIGELFNRIGHTVIELLMIGLLIISFVAHDKLKQIICNCERRAPPKCPELVPKPKPKPKPNPKTPKKKRRQYMRMDKLMVQRE